MQTRFDTVIALFDPNRNGPRFAGFVAGIVVPLILLGLISVAYHGGLSDTSTARAPVYVIE